MSRVALLVVMLSGCTTIGHAAPPKDWPDLKVIAHYVSTKEMRDQCVRWTPAFASPMACSVIDFSKMTCEQWFDQDFTTTSLVRHENEHCRGKDHLGSTYLRDLWEGWKKTKK